MATRRVLIVEDDEALAFELADSLTGHGYHVLGHAPTAEQALALARDLKPNLVLLDVALAGQLDGVEVARKLREQPEIAVVYMTGHADRETVDRAKETAPAAYLMKPFSERELIVTVELALVRQQLEARLHAEREHLRVTLQSIGDAVIATDIEGRVTLLNPVAAQLTGWTEDEARGKPLEEVFNIIDEKSRTKSESPVARVLESGRVIGLANHTALIARDGSERAIADSGSPILDEQGRIVGAVLVFRDITEQLRIEQEMTRAQRLDALGVLAGGLAHDFNNLLAVIAASVSFAARKLDSRDGPVASLLERALAACDRATGLTKQLLTFSSGGAPVRRITAVGELARTTAEFVLHGSKCRAIFEIADDLALADIDDGQIGQVITNLVLNGVEATPGGGVIEVRCKNRTLSDVEELMCEPGPYVEIAVTDHGVGIAPDILSRIFEPYFSTKQRGSGLGLAIAYSIMKQHGGTIVAESKQDEGSTFRLLLPAATRPASSEPACAEVDEPSLHKGVRVLVMDDEDALRLSMMTMLTEFGCTTEGAADGASAVKMFQRARELGHPYDVVILDLTIRGGMGGLETVQQLLAIDPETRAIATSGYAPDPVLGHPRRYGFVASLPKPFRLDDLTTLVHRAARRA